MAESGMKLANPIPLRRWLGFVLAYVVTGKFGLLLALPPGYASAIFPPAGIGVVAALLYGRAALPWVFVSSLLLNLWIGLDIGSSLGWVSIATAIVIGVASSLQAGAGGMLLRRYLGYPLMLGSAQELIIFSLLAPLICLVSASFSVGGMVSLGVIHAGNWGTHWLTWWLGDMLGVLLLVPVILTLLGEPKALWRSRFFSVSVPMLLAFILLVNGYVMVSRWEQKQVLEEFNSISRKSYDELRLRFELLESLLEQTQALLGLPTERGANYLTREQFRHFVQASEKRFTSIQAISWVPRISNKERAEFEATQRRAIPAFSIRERNTDGKLRPATSREYYQPVTYIEPMQGNEKALGFDLASNPSRLEALKLSYRTNGVVATAPIRLVQERHDQAGILLIQSVREGPRKGDVVTIVLRMGDFMSQIASMSDGMIQLRLIDVETEKALFNSFDENGSPPLLDESIVLGTREYRLQAAPSALYLGAHHAWQSWLVLVVGLFCIGMLGCFLLLGTGQRAHAEALVEERTGELRKREQALANAQRIASVGSWEWNINSGSLSWSDEIYRIFGLEPQQFAATYDAFIERVHPADRDRVQQAVDRALNSSERYQVEHRLVRPSGEERYVEEQGVIERDQSGNPVYMIGTVHDITERIKLDRMKREFISTVSHELRTPLTSIRGSLGLLVGKLGAGLPAEARNMLELANRNCERLSILINDLLDLEKIESGQFELELKPVDMVALVRRAVEDNSGFAQKHDVTLIQESSMEAAMVQGDSNRLLQVLANLISNAVKFSPAHGHVDIQIGQTQAGYRISVIDHGSGIPAEFRSRIFGRFAQADSSDTRQKGGTGLGLSIAKVIIENHGGQIGYGETAGGGATFWFELTATTHPAA